MNLRSPDLFWKIKSHAVRNMQWSRLDAVNLAAHTGGPLGGGVRKTTM